MSEELINLEETLEALRGDIKAIKILRDGRYLSTVYPEEIEGYDIQEWLKERYGGGKYTLQLIKKDGKFGKSFTFMIEGKPKEVSEVSHSDPAISILVEQLRELKDEIKRLKGNSEGDIFKYLLEIEKQNRDEIFKLLIELMKNKEEKRSSFLEGLLKEAIKNPQLIGAIGMGVYKLVKTLMAKKDDLVELIKIAKDDPELKAVISDVLSAKYGTNKSFLDVIVENPEVLNRVLDTVNRILKGRLDTELDTKVRYQLDTRNERLDTVSNPDGQVSNQYLTEASNRVSNQLDTEVSNEELNAMEVLLKVFNLISQDLNDEKILNALSEREVYVLRDFISETGIENAEELIGILKASGVPGEYIATLKEKKELINNLIRRLTFSE